MIHWPEYDLLVERLDPLFRNLLKMYRCTLKVHLQLCNNNRAEFIYFLLCVTTHKCSYITIMFVLWVRWKIISTISSLQFVEALKLLSSVFREFQLELLLWLLCRYLRVSSSSAKHKTNYYNITSGLHGSAPQYITVVLTQYFCLWGHSPTTSLRPPLPGNKRWADFLWCCCRVLTNACTALGLTIHTTI